MNLQLILNCISPSSAVPKCIYFNYIFNAHLYAVFWVVKATLFTTPCKWLCDKNRHKHSNGGLRIKTAADFIGEGSSMVTVDVESLPLSNRVPKFDKTLHENNNSRILAPPPPQGHRLCDNPVIHHWMRTNFYSKVFQLPCL